MGGQENRRELGFFHGNDMGNSENGKAPWEGVRERCQSEWTEFRNRLADAEKKYFAQVGKMTEKQKKSCVLALALFHQLSLALASTTTSSKLSVTLAFAVTELVEGKPDWITSWVGVSTQPVVEVVQMIGDDIRGYLVGLLYYL
ncbi:hypothetical protein IFM89_034793 [Coptis chinensis]|uniref:Uncharacterized protein n=1 Tax=Coptis chinensis TaxID=261450 RepID=A0A835H9D7_9MAGN|nr:hypothetical protein IFM89_034793 [Coptis chinensis]